MHQQSYSETNYFEIEGEDSMIAPNGGENEILLNLFIFILFHKLVYFTTRMYPITSFKCKMYKEIVKVMISLMITLYQVKHVSSELAKDVCLSFSVGIFGFVSSAHTAANNWRAHSHRCCFKLQNLKMHWFSFN